MNIYFVNHKYINPTYFEYVLKVLKVKRAFNFFERKELPPEVQSAISPLIVNSLDGISSMEMADKCAFWIKEVIERNVTLLSSIDNGAIQESEDAKRVSQNSAVNNLKYLDDENCMILADLRSNIDDFGNVAAPYYFIKEPWGKELMNHVTEYSLNILRKNYNHDNYANQTAFVSFSEFFANSYRYRRSYREWNVYSWPNSSYTKTIYFIQFVKQQLNKQYPSIFPIVIEDGKRKHTNLLTEEGKIMQKKLLEEAEKIRIEEEKRQDEYDRQESIGVEENRMNERDNAYLGGLYDPD